MNSGSGNINSENETNDLSGKKIGIFPKFIRSIHDTENYLNKLDSYKNSIKMKKKLPINELNGINLGRIPIQYNSSQKNEGNYNNKNDKTPVFICRNNDIWSSKKKSYSKKGNK